MAMLENQIRNLSVSRTQLSDGIHDATITLGLRRYGFDIRAAELAGSLFDLYP